MVTGRGPGSKEGHVTTGRGPDQPFAVLERTPQYDGEVRHTVYIGTNQTKERRGGVEVGSGRKRARGAVIASRGAGSEREGVNRRKGGRGTAAR